MGSRSVYSSFQNIVFGSGELDKDIDIESKVEMKTHSYTYIEMSHNITVQKMDRYHFVRLFRLYAC